MPITIVQPTGPPGSTPNGVLEVGMLIRAQTDFIGPLSDQAFWTTEGWLDSDSEHFVLRRKYPFKGNLFSVFAWEPGINDAAADGEGLLVRPTGVAPATLRIMLDDPTSAFHEQAQSNVTLTVPFDIHMRGVPSGAQAGGFIFSDRQLLQAIYDAVYRQFTIN